ncbi:GTPase activating protein (predicted) [Achlya hypogyna]|uniref:GTPase activating protein (Predicted) n=1 Tax=Achlya hypogyna TaxID=1202772 RepID=A0A1V9ZMH4_ACHHY|nr:GTPase activating protein (predicted) [Achlya hypogyna]
MVESATPRLSNDGAPRRRSMKDPSEIRPAPRRSIKDPNEAFPAPLQPNRLPGRASFAQAMIPEIERSRSGEVLTEDLARLCSVENRELRYGDIVELHAVSAFDTTIKDSAVGFMRWSPSSDIKHLQHVLVVPPVDPALFTVARFVLMPTHQDSRTKLGKTTLRYNQEVVLELSAQTAADCTNTRPPRTKYSLNNKTPMSNIVISAQPRLPKSAADAPPTTVPTKGELHVVFRKDGAYPNMPVQNWDAQVTLHVVNSNRNRTTLNNNVVQYALDTGTQGAYLCCEQKKSIFGFASARPSTKPVAFRIAKVQTFADTGFLTSPHKPTPPRVAVEAEYGFNRERWLQQSGAAAKASSYPSSHYANLHHHSYASKAKDVNIQQIDRDIERTMLYDTASVEQRRLGLATASCRPGNIPMLRRVLVAASWHLTSVGYCQSMDILCAFLLQYFEEEDAFWMLVTLVEDILPGYYTPKLEGIQVDQLVFQQLVQECLPHLSAHLESFHAGVSLLCFHWFLCLYVNVLSTNVTELVWSALFASGPHALFEMGLRILAIAEQELLACDNSVELLETLQDVAVQINASLCLDTYDGSIVRREGKDGLALSPIPSPSPLARLGVQKHISVVRKAFEFNVSAPFIEALRSHYAALQNDNMPEPASIAGLRLEVEESQWPRPQSTRLAAVQSSVESFTRLLPVEALAQPALAPSLDSPQRTKKGRNFELNLPRTLKAASAPDVRIKSRAQSMPEMLPRSPSNASFHLRDLKTLHTSILATLLEDQKNRWRWERQNAKLDWVGYSALSGAILEGSKKGNVAHVSLREERLDAYFTEATDVLVDLVQMVEQCEVTGRVSRVRRVRGLDDTSVYDVPLEVQTIQRVWGQCAAQSQQAWDLGAVRNMLLALVQTNDTILLRDIVIGLAIACEGPPKDRLEFVLGLFDCHPQRETNVIEDQVMQEIIRAIYNFCYDANVHEKTLRFHCFLVTFVDLSAVQLSLSFRTILDLLALHFQLIHRLSYRKL